MDYYNILGVSRDADSSEIHRAYRRKARELHPDRNKDNPKAEEEFKKLGEAYRILSDPKKRHQYDTFGSVGGDYAPPPGWSPEAEYYHFGGGNAYNPYQGDHAHSSMEEFFEDIFTQFRRGGRRSRHSASDPQASKSKRGSNVEVELPVVLKDLFDTKPRRVAISLLHPCRTCSGQGRVGNTLCTECSGTGQTSRRKTFKFTVPRGSEDGAVIRLKGQGQPSPDGRGTAGDLLIRLRFRPDPQFKMEGYDLRTEVRIPDFRAALGGKIELSTPVEKVAIKLASGTPSGKIYRVDGKGLPRKRGGFGDLYVKVLVDVPKHLNPNQKALYEQLEKLSQ